MSNISRHDVVGLSQPELLALYDHDERFAATYPGARREEVGNLVVRQVDTVDNAGVVLYTRLDEHTVEAAIDEQVAYFEALQMELEWKAYSHDRPADLIQRLIGHGFKIDEPEAILVLDLHATPGPVLSKATGVTVKHVERPDDLAPVAAIRRQVYGADASDHLDRLRLELESRPRYLSVYLAYVDGAPVACGWARFPEESAFASLWGGSTIPALRNRGVYTALLAARIREATDRGSRYLTVDARKMSRPILERRGFQLLTTATACVWSPPTVTA